jgi:hypothetical protein
MTGLEDVWIARMNQAFRIEDPAPPGGREGEAE